MIALIYWKELLILILFSSCLWLINLNQDARYEAKEIKLIHEKLVSDAKANTADVAATYNRQRQLDAEKYASEISDINDKYAIALSNSNRVYEKVTTYNDRLHITTRKTLENYAKTGSLLYSECRKEYLNLGYYTAKVDAELDSKTKAP